MPLYYPRKLPFEVADPTVSAVNRMGRRNLPRGWRKIMFKVASLSFVVAALVLGGSLSEANATNDKGQLNAMCRDMISKKGLKDPDQRRAEFQKCLRDPSSYK
jgi:hypothetical protein